mgnify:CR=1 FL=1
MSLIVVTGTGHRTANAYESGAANAPLLVIAGCAESLYTTTNTTILQLVAPEHLRGSMAAMRDNAAAAKRYCVP